MYKINKIDYMVGAFLSCLSSKDIAPVLVESTEDSKIVKFSTNKKDYEIYFKYAIGNKKTYKKFGKTFNRWTITFTPKDLANIKDLERKDITKLSLNLCGTTNYTDTEIAVLSFEQLKKCIGIDTYNENKRLAIKRVKGSPQLQCYGTSLDEINAIKITRGIENYIEF